MPEQLFVIQSVTERNGEKVSSFGECRLKKWTFEPLCGRLGGDSQGPLCRFAQHPSGPVPAPPAGSRTPLLCTDPPPSTRSRGTRRGRYPSVPPRASSCR